MSVGDIIGQYRLEQELGRGTFGVVYRAVHVKMDTLRVAVKRVHPSLAKDKAFVEAIQIECQTLDTLNHPGIVGFKTLEMTEDTIAILLELLEGKDLHDVMRKGPMSLVETERIIRDVLDALSYAHRKKVIHRDIKPSNIFQCTDGTVKLMDFGISRAADGSKASQTGQIVGTFDYMSPEAFDGHVTPAVDTYAVGLVAWELLTGRIACPEGSLARKMRWHIGEELTDVRALRPDCSPYLAEFIKRLVSKEPELRPGDGTRALKLLDELKEKKTPFSPIRSKSMPPPGTVSAAMASDAIAEERASMPPGPHPDLASLEAQETKPPQPPPLPEHRRPHVEPSPSNEPTRTSPLPTRPPPASQPPASEQLPTPTAGEQQATTSPPPTTAGGSRGGLMAGLGLVAAGGVLLVGLIAVAGAVGVGAYVLGNQRPGFQEGEVTKEMAAMPAGGDIETLRAALHASRGAPAK